MAQTFSGANALLTEWCQTEILIFIRHFAVTPAKQCANNLCLFCGWQLQSLLSQAALLFLSIGDSVLLFAHPSSSSGEECAPYPLCFFHQHFAAFCFEVIMQELSNQSLIILLHGSRSVWMGSNLINTTFLVSIPLMASAIPSAWLTPWSGSWQV